MMGRWIVRTAHDLKYALSGRTTLPSLEKLPSRILIIRPFFMGDIILSLPVAQAIKRQRPDARVTWLLREEWKDLVNGHSAVDEVIAFSARKMHSGVKSAGEFRRVARELRRRSFDLVLNLTWDRSSTLWSRLSGAPIRVGIEEFGRPRLLSLLNHRTVTAPERSADNRHMADFYHEPLKLLGFGQRAELPRLFPLPGEQETVDRRLAAAFGAKNPFLLIHPGGRLARKRWPLERFDELVQKLARQASCRMVLVCGPDEAPWASQIALSLPPGRGFFWPAPSFGELIAMSSRASLFIGNDSGPMHLAAAAGCRVLAILSTTSGRWKPLGTGHRTLGGEGGPASVSVDSVMNAMPPLTG